MLFREKTYVYPESAKRIKNLLQMTGEEIKKNLESEIGEIIYGDIIEFEDGMMMTYSLISSEKPYTLVKLLDENFNYLGSVKAEGKYFGEWIIKHNDDTYILKILEVPKFAFNKDVKRRDEIIFGKYEPEKYRYGMRRFKDFA